MILILSDTFETSTSDVIEWLDFYNAEFILLTEKNRIKNFNLIIDKSETININITTTQGENDKKIIIIRNNP